MLSDSELIGLLEGEMLDDVLEIDVPPSEEHLIDMERVYEWYMSTEKVIRVLGNLFSSPTFQSVNQLRYAGHHILKAQLFEEGRQSNLIEAFKHCKRALYDAFDFYIYRLNEYYRSLLPYLTSERAIELENQMHELIVEINACRIEASQRISYYSGVQNNFIKGLKIIKDLNHIQRKDGISETILKARRQLVVENAQLLRERNALEADNKRYMQQIGSRANRLAIALTLAITLGTIAGLIGSALITNVHKVMIANPITLVTPDVDNEETK